MGGLGNLFKRILPIIMIICFICLGITHIFKPTPNRQLTYLTQETIHSDITNTDTTFYKFDTNAYMSNITSNTLKESLNLEDSFSTYQQVLRTFGLIWADGYQIGDIIKTIGNAVILLIDTLIMPINFILIPIRISMAILLTTLSLIGINTGYKVGLIKFITVLATEIEIPLLSMKNDTQSVVIDSTIQQGSQWQINNSPLLYANKQIDFIFYDTDYTEYKAIKYEITNATINNPIQKNSLYYQKANDTWILVYEKIGFTQTWTNDKYKTIILGNNNFTNQQWIDLYIELSQIATPITNQNLKTYILPRKEYAFC